MLINKTSVRMILFILFFASFFLHAQEFNWTKGFGGVSTDYGNSVITDSKGNIYLTGEFFTSFTAPPLPTITSAGNVDYFLVKLDSLGNGKWVRKAGGTLTDRGYGLRLDKQGNIITGGVLFGVCTFEGGANPNVVLTSAGNLDGFVAKYDTAGTMLWIKQAASVSQASVRRISIDNQNNIIAAGYFGSTGIDTVRIDSVTIHGAGQRDAFIAKFDSSGNILWGRNIGSTQSAEECRALGIDANDNIYACGFFSGTVNLEGGITLTTTGLEDIFVVKYSPSGSVIWAKSFGGLKNDEAQGLAIDLAGNVIVGGNFDSAAVFGTNNLLSAGTSDAYLLKLDPDGNIIWVKTGGGTEAEAGFDVVIDKIGNYYFTGYFRSTANFGGTNIVTAGIEDVFMACYDSSGTIINLKRGGGTSSDRGFGLAIDAGGNVMVTGRFAGTATFGTTTLTSAGTDDIFLAKIGDHYLPGSTLLLSVDVNAGWNMVSIPGLHPVDQNVDTWWPFKALNSSVFQFNGSYQQVTTAVPGKGYWMRHSDVRTYNTGDEWPAGGITIVPNTPIPGNAGWNMIGCYNYSVPTSGITVSAGSLLGSVFGYSGGYNQVTTLVPGYGYWIRLSQAADIILPNPTFKAANKIAGINDKWGRIILTDKTGTNYTLYAADGQTDLSQFDMPPAPPAGMMDVRYSSQRYVENLNEAIQTIDFNGMESPVTVKVENMSIKLQDLTGKIINTILKTGETVSVSNINKLLVSGQVLPTEYSLAQNYPNPFNPTTKINYSLQFDSKVTLEVFSITGEKLAQLVNEEQSAGYYSVNFGSSKLASGVYIYRIKAVDKATGNNFSSVKKMIMLK